MALVSTTQSPVDCSGIHNAITVGVMEVPANQAEPLAALVEAGQAVGTDGETTRRSVLAPACAPAYAGAFSSAAVQVDADGVATAYKASTLRGYAWLPTAQQWAGGARWIRCDVANRTAEPIAFDTRDLELSTIPEALASCLNADVEGFIPMDCDDPEVNGQALVTIVLEDAATKSATADYAAFAADAGAMCADAVTAAFPDVAGEGKAALPIAFSFAGQFDCYVDRSADDPLVS